MRPHLHSRGRSIACAILLDGGLLHKVGDLQSAQEGQEAESTESVARAALLLVQTHRSMLLML